MSLKGEKERKCGGGGKRNIFFMWQMASFYVRVMSSSCFCSAFDGESSVEWRRVESGFQNRIIRLKSK